MPTITPKTGELDAAESLAAFQAELERLVDRSNHLVDIVEKLREENQRLRLRNEDLEEQVHNLRVELAKRNMN